MNKKIDKDSILDLFLITIGISIAAVAIYFFLIPANLVLGSISGLALIIVKVIPVSISMITFVFNVVLLIIGYMVVGKEFTFKTIYASLLFPLLLYLFENLYPNQTSIMQDIWLDLLAYILISSIAQTILFKANASSGGVDIIAKVINHIFSIPIGSAVSIAGSLISLSAIFVYDLKVVLIGIMGTYLNGIIINYFTDTFNQKKRICIISEKYDAIADYILHNLTRGITLYPKVGGYSKKEGFEIQIIVETNEVAGLIRSVNNIDKKAFITVSNVSQISGQWHAKKLLDKL